MERQDAQTCVSPFGEFLKGNEPRETRLSFVGRTFSLTTLVNRQAKKPDLRNAKRSSAGKRACSVIILEKANQSQGWDAKPRATLKAQFREKLTKPNLERDSVIECGSLVAERMLVERLTSCNWSRIRRSRSFRANTR